MYSVAMYIVRNPYFICMSFMPFILHSFELIFISLRLCAFCHYAKFITIWLSFSFCCRMTKRTLHHDYIHYIKVCKCLAHKTMYVQTLVYWEEWLFTTPKINVYVRSMRTFHTYRNPSFPRYFLSIRTYESCSNRRYWAYVIYTFQTKSPPIAEIYRDF